METKEKKIYDSIHGIITFSNIYWNIIDNPIFQRTREIHQLGSIYFVFPSASHNRFEHSLGTAHLANKFIMKLKHNLPDQEITDEYCRSLTIASLTHNIGHPPFSYAFNDFVRDGLGIKNWSHEMVSTELMENIIDFNHIDVSREEINLSKELILGKKNYFGESAWMYQILHNKTNGVDVDKFDFILRDTKKFGIPNQAFDYEVLVDNARLLNNNICYRSSDSFLLYELFLCRYRLFKEFYLHRVSKGIDIMLKDVFEFSNCVYDYKSYLEDTERYIKLNDSILNKILYSNDPRLQKSQNIIKRIYSRELYKFVAEIVINTFTDNYEIFLSINEKDIAHHGCNLEIEDISLMKLSLDFGKDEQDPVDYVKFYDKKQVHGLSSNEISNILPNKFKELILRLYVKDIEKFDSAKEAFTKYCKEKLGQNPSLYEKESRSAKKLTFK